MAPDHERGTGWAVPDFVPSDWAARYGTRPAPGAVSYPRRSSRTVSWVAGLRLSGWLAVVVVSIVAIAWPVTGVAAGIAGLGLVGGSGAVSALLARMVLDGRVGDRAPKASMGRSLRRNAGVTRASGDVS